MVAVVIVASSMVAVVIVASSMVAVVIVASLIVAVVIVASLIVAVSMVASVIVAVAAVNSFVFISLLSSLMAHSSSILSDSVPTSCVVTPFTISLPCISVSVRRTVLDNTSNSSVVSFWSTLAFSSTRRLSFIRVLPRTSRLPSIRYSPSLGTSVDFPVKLVMNIPRQTDTS